MLSSAIQAQTNDTSLFNYVEREAEATCTICETWNSATTSRRRKRSPDPRPNPRPVPRRGGGGRGNGSSGSKGKPGKGSSSSTSSKSISKITTAYLISSTGKRLLSNSKWVKPTKPRNWSDDDYEEWEEEAMTYLAYVDENGVCQCSGFKNLINLSVLLFGIVLQKFFV